MTRLRRFAATAGRPWRVVVLLLGALSVVANSAFAQTTHLLIVVGLAADAEHGEVFKKWGSSLADTAAQKLGARVSRGETARA